MMGKEFEYNHLIREAIPILFKSASKDYKNFNSSPSKIRKQYSRTFSNFNLLGNLTSVRYPVSFKGELANANQTY